MGNSISYLTSHEQHQNQESNNDGIKGEYVGKTSEAVFDGVTFAIKEPPPNGTHDNRK